MNKITITLFGLFAASFSPLLYSMDLKKEVPVMSTEISQETEHIFALVSRTDEPEYQLEMIKQYIDKANVNATLPWRQNPDWTPLHWAAYNGLHEICAFLIKAGAKVNAVTDNGTTPLHLAAEAGHTDACSVLLSNGAHLHAVITHQLTPLHLAAKKASLECSRLLLHNGGRANALDSDGIPVLLYAAHGGSKEVCAELIPLTVFIPKETKAETESYKAVIAALYFIRNCGFSRDIKILILKRLLAHELHEEFVLCSFKHLRRKLALFEICTAVPDFMRGALELRLFDTTMTTLHSSRNLTSLIKSPTLNELFAPAIRSNIARFLGAPEPQVTEVESTPELVETL